MLNFDRIFILAINALGLLLSLFVFIAIVKTKYKDFSNYTILMLISYDILQATAGILGIFGNDSMSCETIIFFLIYARQCHVLLIFLIGFSLFRYIARENKLSRKVFMTIFLVGNLYAVLYGFLSVFLNKTNSKLGVCILNDPVTTAEMINFIFGDILPSATVEILIIYYYYEIGVRLKNEASIVNLNCSRSRVFAKRLLGYCFVFSLYFLPFLVVFFEGDYYLSEMALIGFYPVANSLMYGSTQSTKKNIFNICIKNDPFDDDQEKTIDELRNGGMLHPRFYLDLIGVSESEIFNINLR